MFLFHYGNWQQVIVFLRHLELVNSHENQCNVFSRYLLLEHVTDKVEGLLGTERTLFQLEHSSVNHVDVKHVFREAFYKLELHNYKFDVLDHPIFVLARFGPKQPFQNELCHADH